MAQEKKLAAGQRFGKWTLVGDEPVGKGGNAAVWKAEGEGGPAGAIKLLQSQFFQGKRFARFRHEIHFMRAESGRKGILPLLDFNLPDDPTIANRPWLVTPLATPFHKLTLSGPARLPELVKRIESVARTLAGLHAEGKWHRDLKPENLFDLDGASLIGDFGLVDYPDKEALTEPGEVMGPRHYLAFEMLTNAADAPAGPADVYALAKTLWVLASGQAFPLQGEQRTDTPGLRLSSYCPHPRADILDRLLERATRIDPEQRPTMAGFADELAAWLTTPKPEAVKLDLDSLTKEYGSAFQSSYDAMRKRGELITEAQGILNTFQGMLEQIARATEGVTRIPCDIVAAHDLPSEAFSIEAFEMPSVLWREGQSVETVARTDMTRVTLQSFVLVEALSDETIRIVVGHSVTYQAGASDELVDMKFPWGLVSVGAVGSASLENDIQTSYTEFLKNLPQGIKTFGAMLRGEEG